MEIAGKFIGRQWRQHMKNDSQLVKNNDLPRNDDDTKDLPFVIGAGLMRTGTHSLQEALATLGYERVFHMSEIMTFNFKPDALFEVSANERATGVKNETLALQAAQSLIDQGYMATTDAPGCLLYKEFLELTDGKVILTVRSSPTAWKKSVLDTIANLHRPFFKPPFSFFAHFRALSTFDLWIFERMGGVASLGEIDAPKESLHDYEHNMESAYVQWVETVKKQVPPENLLILDPKEGYPPLCEFLGIEEAKCPTREPYPHIGNAEQMKLLVRIHEIVADSFWPVVALQVFFVLFLGRRAWLRSTVPSKCSKKKMN